MKLQLVLIGFLTVVVSALEFVPVPEPNPFNIPFKPIGRITNGERATRSQFRYQVGLRLTGEKASYWCGGTLISDRWVLTAAHCTEGILSVNVYLGAWNRNDKDEEGQQIVFSGKRYIIVHEQYDPEAIKNDIALIKLPAEIRFNDYIQPANLPRYRAEGDYPTYEGVVATASGWGVTEEGSSPDILRYIEKPIMKLSSCSRWYLGSLTASQQICITVTNKQSTCNGDSGGPLVVEEEGKPVVIGATSFGVVFGCQSGWPGVFTRTTGYLEWIHQQTGLVEGL